MLSSPFLIDQRGIGRISDQMSNLATQSYKDKRHVPCNPHKAVRTLGADYDLEAAWSSEPFLNLARTTIAPKLLYDRKECDLATLLTPLVNHILLYSRK